MSKTFFFFFLGISIVIHSQESPAGTIPPSSLLYNLPIGDSVVFYQCHVEEAIQQLNTASGQTLSGTPQKYSITEKYVLIKRENFIAMNYYTSSLNAFPNRKFSGLKIREKAYWAFKQVASLQPNERELNVFLALEKKGREAIEFDFEINKYTTNQLIIKRKKNFKQLVIDGQYVISKLIRTSM
ncbi:MAG: hypothetical protein PSX36_03530 [bacterium]|nr:hypothetical protein [bacterium]